MAYFDNASTTYPKPYCVYDFMDSFYRSSGANAGRGNYKLFLCGASSKDAGARITSIVEDYGVSKYTPVIATLLKNPTLILPQ